MLLKISSKLLLSISSLGVSAVAGARLSEQPGGDSGCASLLVRSGDCGGPSSLRRAVEGWVPLRGMVAAGQSTQTKAGNGCITPPRLLVFRLRVLHSKMAPKIQTRTEIRYKCAQCFLGPTNLKKLRRLWSPSSCRLHACAKCWRDPGGRGHF